MDQWPRTTHWHLPKLASSQLADVYDSSPSPTDTPALDPVRLERWARYCGYGVLAVAVSALAGWMSDRLLLASLGGGYIPMAPSTALCFILLALPLVFQHGLAHLPDRPWLAVFPGFTGLFGALILLQLGTGLAWDVESLLVASPAPFATVVIGRMSPLTAAGMLMLGMGLALVTWRREKPLFGHAAGVLATATLVLSLVVTLGYVYTTPFLYGATIIPMALTTALCFAFCSAGLLFRAGRDAWPLRIVTGNALQAQLLRAFLPITPAIILVEGLLYRFLPVTNPAMQGALLVLLTSVVMVTMVYVIAAQTSRRLERAIRLRREAERQIDAQRLVLEERAAMLDLANSAIFSRDMEGRIQYWNKGAEQLFGFGRDEALGRTVASLLAPEYSMEYSEIEAVLLEEDVWEGEGVFRCKDGSSVSLASRWALQRDSNGTPQAIVKVNMDLTPLKEASRRIEEQLERTQLLNDIARAIAERHDIESIFRVLMAQLERDLPIDFGGVFLTTDEPGRLQVVARGPKGRELARQLGTEEGKMFEVTSALLHRALEGHTVYEKDIATLDDGLSQRYAEAGLRSVVAAPVIVDSMVQGVLTAMRTAPDGFTGAEVRFLQQATEQVAVAMQSTRQFLELERAYDELRKTQDAMLQQERLRALGQMAGGITHDINNALSPVVGYSDLLLATEKGLSEEGRNYIETIRMAGYDIGAIIARLREFYRPKEESQIHGPVDLNVLAKQVIELTSPRWKDASQQRHITIAVDKALCEGPCLVADAESEIREALINLFINGLDSLDTDGAIVLRTGKDDSTTWIAVEDTGAGMDASTQRSCLEPFFTTKGDKGTGLGLGMVFGVMQRHKGRIEIDSAPGKGTRMRLCFPPMDVAEASSAVVPSVSDVPPLRILYVDDEPHLRELVKRMLEVDGHEVDTADGGQAGIDAVRASAEAGLPYDLVVSDLGMPYVGGRQVALAVKEFLPGTPFVLLTGWGNRLNAEGDIPPNVDVVLSKPPKLEDLREAVSRLWRGPKAQG